MNRFSPMIVRQPYTPAKPFAAWEAPAPEAPRSSASDDLKLFLTSFAGGLVFFGTLFF